MKRTVLALAFAVAFSSSLLADVTIKGTGDAKILGMSKAMPTTTYIKGNKMRTDMVNGDKTVTTIFDLDSQKMYSFDSKKKEADVWDMAPIAEEINKVANPGEIKASIKPNGQTKQIAGKTATGYDVSVSVPFAMGGDKGMAMTMNLIGHMFVVKGAPGTADYVAWYKTAGEKGWIFQDPKTAKAQPGQAKAMAKYYEQFASTGGLPYESDMEMKASGDGPMAGLMARALNLSMTNTIESTDTATIPAEMFAPPAGYKLNVKK